MSTFLLVIYLASCLPGAVEDPAKTPSSNPPVTSSAAPEIPAPAPPAGSGTPSAHRPTAPVLPAATGPSSESSKVDWSGLSRSGLRFIGVMHAFRWVTEPGTRAGGFGLGSGYTSSVARLHGWADGDPFYVNYVGHPMQGSVANYLWQLHDTRFKHVEFGRSRGYWQSRLRGAAFAWAFSEQFEIGPLSEASIGHIQRDFPQQGLVDHVVTPSVGLGWTIAEDALDRYVVRAIEDRTYNRWVRLAARSFLNPARAFANVLDSRPPWYRASRAGILSYSPTVEPVTSPTGEISELPGAPSLEFAPVPVWRRFGGNSCVGGGAEEVGPRWSPVSEGKWSPYAHLLIGGMKVTQERFDPALKHAVLAANQNLDSSLSYTLHDQYTATQEANAIAVTAGVGVNYKLNSALALRIANLEYLRSHAPTTGGVPYGRGFQMSAGMVLRLGTW